MEKEVDLVRVTNEAFQRVGRSSRENTKHPTSGIGCNERTGTNAEGVRSLTRSVAAGESTK